MTPNITPEALDKAVELALTAIRAEEARILGAYKTPDNGARRKTIKAGILAALPELLAAQPVSSAGGQEPVTRRERDLMLALGAADVSVSGGFDGVPWKIHLPTAAPVAGEAVQPQAEQQPDTERGLYRKFDVRRTDGSHRPGGKHFGCEYFVLDMTHDPHAPAAARAYAESAEATHPALAADMRERYALSGQPAPAAVPVDAVRAAAERALAAHDAFQERPGRITGKEANEADKALREAIASATQPAAPQGVDLGLRRRLRAIQAAIEGATSYHVDETLRSSMRAWAMELAMIAQHQQQESGA